MSLSTNRALEGWELKPLTEVATVIMGQSPPGSTYNTVGQGLPFFQGKAEFGDDNPTPRKWCTSPTRVAERGDLLMSVRAPVGPTNVADQKCAIGRGLAIIRGNDGVPTDLIRHAIRWREDEIASWGTGTTFTAINKAHFGQILIPLPPVDLRASLVAVLNRTIAHRRESSLHLRAARRAVERFRHSVLAAACSGRLTADWREEHPYVKANKLVEELAERRRELLGPKAKPPTAIAADGLMEIPSSWAWGSVDSLASHVTDGEHKTPQYQPKGIPFITVRNLTAGAGIDFENTKFISEQEHERFTRRLLPERGDLLVSKDGTIGVTRAVRTDRPFSIFVSVAIIKPLLRQMSDYLELALSSPQVQRQMVGVGSGLQHLVVRDLKADGVPLPAPEEQREIVRRVERLLSLVDSLTARIKTASRYVERTSQAVLAKAFRGDLLA